MAGMCTAATQSVNIRSGDSSGSSVAAVADAKEQWTRFESSPSGWYKLSNSKRGITGWSYKTFWTACSDFQAQARLLQTDELSSGTPTWILWRRRRSPRSSCPCWPRYYPDRCCQKTRDAGHLGASSHGQQSRLSRIIPQLARRRN